MRRISLAGQQTGIGIRVADVSEILLCETHYAFGKLPETLNLPLTCSEGRATYVRPHYRAGRYVIGHYRSGSHVRAHYRRRR